jgi:DNA-binding NtrC family response regulator
MYLAHRYAFHESRQSEIEDSWAVSSESHLNWPGNVRELLRAVEAARVLSEGPNVLPEHLPASLRNSKPGLLP